MKYGLVPTATGFDTSLLEAYFETRHWSRTRGPDWDLLWYVGRDPPREVLAELQSGQRMNHFPGISQHTAKSALVDTLANARLHDPATAFDFYPPTWRFPDERESCLQFARAHPGYRWVHKPADGSWGHGVAVYRDVEAIPDTPAMLVQCYLDDPLTHEGRKFNLRVYLLITCLTPMVAWVYRDGYVDLAMTPYVARGDGFDDPRVFNTNTHVQTRLTGLDAPSCSLSLRRWLGGLGTDADTGWRLWDAIRTLLGRLARAIGYALLPELSPYLVNPRNCFELLGLDLQIGRDLRPWLIECNRSPELAALSSKAVKKRLIADLVELVQPGCAREPATGAPATGFERLDTRTLPE